MHRNEIESVRARITHLKEQVDHVRNELSGSGEAKVADERDELDRALGEADEADRQLAALEDLEAAEERPYRPDPGAARMAKLFLVLFGLFVIAVFVSHYVG